MNGQKHEGSQIDPEGEMTITRKMVLITLGVIIPLYMLPSLSVMWEILIVMAWALYFVRNPLKRAAGKLFSKTLEWTKPAGAKTRYLVCSVFFAVILTILFVAVPRYLIASPGGPAPLRLRIYCNQESCAQAYAHGSLWIFPRPGFHTRLGIQNIRLCRAWEHAPKGLRLAFSFWEHDVKHLMYCPGGKK